MASRKNAAAAAATAVTGASAAIYARMQQQEQKTNKKSKKQQNRKQSHGWVRSQRNIAYAAAALPAMDLLLSCGLPTTTTTTTSADSISAPEEGMRELMKSFREQVNTKYGQLVSPSLGGYQPTLEEVRIRLQVARRFLDIMSRSAFAVCDYKIQSYLQNAATANWKQDAPNEELNLYTWNKDDESSDSPSTIDAKARFILSKAGMLDLRERVVCWLMSPNGVSSAHARSAQSFFEACSQHGGLLVKLGQYISTNMAGMLPNDYIEALRPLQDSCSPLAFPQVKAVIQRELWAIRCPNQPYDHNRAQQLMDETFLSIDDVPLGSASLAQVHKARLNDAKGTIVAIKVQRPGLHLSTKADLAALSILSNIFDYIFPGTGFEWMIPEFHNSIAAELDFTQEARNAERCKSMLEGCPLTNSAFPFFTSSNQKSHDAVAQHGTPPHAIVPNMMKHLTSSKMLTMSFEEGFRVTDMDQLRKHNIDPLKVASATCALFAELMYLHGFVHADPHPGNILVRPRPNAAGGEFDLVLLDHGMYRRLDEDFRHSYSELWAGLVSGDNVQAARGVRGLGLPEDHLDIVGFLLVYRIPTSVLSTSSTFGVQKLGSLLGKESKEQLAQQLKERFGEDFFSPQAMNRYIEQLPRDLLFCFRCTQLVRGINRELGGSSLDRFVTFGTAASRGTKLPSTTVENGSETTTKREYSSKTIREKEHTSGEDALAKAIKSLNQPVQSELLAKEKQNNAKRSIASKDTTTEKTTTTELVTASAQHRTISDVMDWLRISFRIWYKSFVVDLFLMMHQGQSKTDVSSRRLG